MRVKDVAREVGCSPDWLKRLERKGVLPIAPRDRNGHRRYDKELVRKIRRVLFERRERREGAGRGGKEETA